MFFSISFLDISITFAMFDDSKDKDSVLDLDNNQWYANLSPCFTLNV